MTDSRIQVTPHTVSYVGLDATLLFRAKTIRRAIALHKATGMIMTRGATITKMLAETTKLTGKPYKGASKHDAALADLDGHIAASAAEIPVVFKAA